MKILHGAAVSHKRRRSSHFSALGDSRVFFSSSLRSSFPLSWHSITDGENMIKHNPERQKKRKEREKEDDEGPGPQGVFIFFNLKPQCLHRWHTSISITQLPFHRLKNIPRTENGAGNAGQKCLRDTKV